MIIGSGIDLIEISRVAKAIEKPRFRERVFTARELLDSKMQGHRLAGFFAAKEALLKAMGTGLSHFSWLEIEVRHDRRGAPFLETAGKVRSFLTGNGVSRIHLSISHGKEYAVAQVILEAGDRR
ncbi:MAG: holo-ACP synthase [Firmicutes bacterium]|nr:holo-ACP synthase [Bacillota bacterium]